MVRAVLLSVSCLMVFSCGKEVIPETYTDNEIALFPKSIDGGLQTKAVTTLSTLESSGFRASATTVSGDTETQVWTNSLFTKSGELFKGGRYWPSTNRGYRFYGSSSALTFTSSGNTVTVPEGNTADVVCAYKASSNYMTANSLDFHHILSKITTVRVNAESPCTISNITISLVDAKTGGVYNLRSGAWSSKTPASSSNRQLYRNAGSVAAGSGHTGSDNDYLFVPGSYYLQASWTATAGEYTKTYTNKLSTSAVTFAAENQYSVTANLSGDPTKIEFAVSVEPWGSNTVAIGTFPIYSGAIRAPYSVSDSKTVYFAQGNLQATYNGSSWTWKFADYQWDYVGNAAANISINGDGTVSSNGTVDLFGWVGASSTWTGVAMYGISNSETTNSTNTYGNVITESLKADWGSIPGVVSAYGDGWFTLSSTEWKYVISDRTSGATVNGTPNARYTGATINTDGTGVNGIILFPDGVTIASSEVTAWGTVNSTSSWATKCTTAQWSALESKGCVFLPAAGYRYGASVYSVGSYGYYWSSTPYSGNVYYAYLVYFYSGGVYPQNDYGRYGGFSVRLARDVN